jgi:hypothetical protein
VIFPSRLAAAFISTGLCVAAASCASRVAYSPPPPIVADQPLALQVPYDQAWGAVVQTFFQKNIPIRTVEKESGILESDELRGEVGRECDCGTYLGIPVAGYGAYGGDAYYRFRVLVEKRSDRETSLVLRSSCRAKIENLEGELVCHLLPAKESELRGAISERVANAAPKP